MGHAGSLVGGFGERVGAYLMTSQFHGSFRALGLPDKFVTQGSCEELLQEVGLDPHGIASSIVELVGQEATDDKGLLRKLGLRRNSTSKRQLG